MKAWTAFLALLLSTMGFAQQVSLRGLVLDPAQKGIPTANLLLQDTAGKPIKGTITGADGSFVVEKLAPGSYTLAISSVGYGTANLSLRLQGDTSLTVTLTPAAKALTGVVVSASKKLFEMKPDKLVMNVDGNALAVGNSVFEVIRKAPAVKTDKDDNLLMKGLNAAIFIDGKQSYLSGSQLTEYLKNLPAESVASIEFITNPGSKYPAEGNGGIINIRLKKNTIYGTNGQASVGMGYGRYPKYRAALNANYRNKNLNLFGSSSVSYSKSYNELTYNSRIVSGNDVSYQDRNNYWNPRTWWQSYKLGLDYTLNPKSLVGFVLNLDREKDTVVTTNTSSFRNDQKDLQNKISSIKKGRENLTSGSANLNFRRTVDAAGSEWTADADYSLYKRKEHSRNENVFQDGAGIKWREDFVFFNQQPAQVQLLSAKTDYTQVFSADAKLEAGFKWSQVTTDNNLQSDSLTAQGWQRDQNVSNHFVLNETIAAGYTTYTGKWKGVEVQLGLRAEQTLTKGDSKTYNQVTKRQYLDFFPTAFLSKKLSDLHDLSISYARRISRPGYSSLNPFVNYIDPFTRFEGNPYLKAAYSNSFELKHGYKQWLMTSLSYNRVSDNIIRTILQDNTTKVIVNKSQNAGKLSSVRMDVSITTSRKWWSAATSIGAGYSHELSTLAGYAYDTKAFGGDISSNHSFTLPHGLKFLIDGFYSLPEKNGLAQIRSGYAVNVGAQKTFWNNKATIRLNGNTVLGRPQYRAHYLGSGLDIRWVNEWEGRRVNLNFSYKFGNQKVKPARQKRDALEAEKGRVSF